MAQAEQLVTDAGPLMQLAERLDAAEGFAEVVASLHAGHGATLDGVWGSSCALVVAALARHAPGPLLVVCPQPSDLDDFCDDLALFTPERPERLPAWESTSGERSVDDETFGDRLRLLKSLDSDEPPRLIVASIQALLQPVPERKAIARQTRRLAVGDSVDVEMLARWLVEQGFQNTSAVQLPGEFSSRGGIVDLFAPDWYDPVRVELFGDQIESIRRFEVASQRSLAALDAVELTVMAPTTGGSEYFSSYLPEGSWVLLVEPSQLREEGRHYLQRLEPGEPSPQPSPRGRGSNSSSPAPSPESRAPSPEPVAPSPEAHALDDVLERLYHFPSVTASSISIGSMETTCRLKIESVERFSGDIAKVRGELETAGEGQEVFVVCQAEAEAKRLGEIFEGTRLASAGKLHFPLGRLRAGFRLVIERVVLVSGNELFHRADLSRPSRRRLGRVIDSFLELREGDFVVHLAHGIGRYRGLKLLGEEGEGDEHLEIEYHGGTKIYVPSSKIELVQKYVGGQKSRPTLARIGGQTWLRHKKAAEAAVTDLAAEMLEMQAARASRHGISFPPDSEWQREFDALFPYMETPDQLTGIAAIKRDMQHSQPMDRLICGDVGYGKTELAMRAAFKAIDAGYQVAVLVPTTVLAEQHGRTFRGRMAEFPFEIAVLSRFCTATEQKKIVQGLAEGSIDVVIGTHRLAQADIQFNNLGLVVIDEEQRFGVAVKERLKAYRQMVDVMTLTATPIPRTLHMSLLGLRDISNLETPPADRLPIETRVVRFDHDLIRHAALR
ncbi:MAG TPA: DEAD/DEAH box helicase, partial [Pirellulales bacterium]|nr:DEAD/DEAH box helicase [Pirellulales bacterium]